MNRLLVVSLKYTQNEPSEGWCARSTAFGSARLSPEPLVLRRQIGRADGDIAALDGDDEFGASFPLHRALSRALASSTWQHPRCVTVNQLIVGSMDALEVARRVVFSRRRASRPVRPPRASKLIEAHARLSDAALRARCPLPVGRPPPPKITPRPFVTQGDRENGGSRHASERTGAISIFRFFLKIILRENSTYSRPPNVSHGWIADIQAVSPLVGLASTSLLDLQSNLEN